MSTVIHAAGHGLVPGRVGLVPAADFLSPYDFFRDLTNPALAFLPRALLIAVVAALVRSEERRVGKECRAGGGGSV